MTQNVVPLKRAQRELAAETSSTLRAFRVVEILAQEGRPLTLSDMIQLTGLPKPTLHRILTQFEDAGLLVREPDGRSYVVGDRLSRYALNALRHSAAGRARRAILHRLVGEIQESCNVAVFQKGDVIYVDRVEADWPLRLHVPSSGVSLRPHCCASGKLLLAHLPAEERDRLVELMALERFTERTITDRHVLLSELDRILGVGYAVDTEEYVLGVACVAVPVRDRRGVVVAALAVQGATARLPLMRALDLVPQLQVAAQQITATLG